MQGCGRAGTRSQVLPPSSEYSVFHYPTAATLLQYGLMTLANRSQDFKLEVLGKQCGFVCGS